MKFPILKLDQVRKFYSRGFLRKQITFSLEADLEFGEPSIVGLMGANGTGKTTLFEIMTGGNPPTEGRVFCMGQDIYQVRYRERDRLAIHYHQSYQVRKLRRTKPSFMLESVSSDYPMVHLFDEPQFNTQDGYIGFMLDFFRKLRENGRLVFVCLHPMEHYHLQIMEETCDQFMFIDQGKVLSAGGWQEFIGQEYVKRYLGENLDTYLGT
mgnify:FL=1